MSKIESLKQFMKTFHWVLSEDYKEFQLVEKKAKKLLIIAAILIGIFAVKYFGLMPF